MPTTTPTKAPRCAKQIQRVPSFEQALMLARAVHAQSAGEHRRNEALRTAAEGRTAATELAIELHRAAELAKRAQLAETYRRHGLHAQAEALLTENYVLLLEES